jgi:hypothetical protein
LPTFWCIFRYTKESSYLVLSCILLDPGCAPVRL